MSGRRMAVSKERRVANTAEPTGPKGRQTD